MGVGEGSGVGKVLSTLKPHKEDNKLCTRFGYFTCHGNPLLPPPLPLSEILDPPLKKRKSYLCYSSSCADSEIDT